jgi:hypothetical protein
MWGWVLGAALISYSRMKPSSVLASETFKRNSAKRAQTSVISPALSSALVGLIGLLIALPPLRSDLVWKSALDSRDATKVEKALVPNLFNPVSTNRYNSAVALFETSNLKELAHKYALLGVEFNPNNYDAWKNLYQIENTTGSEKAKALERMKMLDPKNPNLKAT